MLDRALNARRAPLEEELALLRAQMHDKEVQIEP